MPVVSPTGTVKWPPSRPVPTTPPPSPDAQTKQALAYAADQFITVRAAFHTAASYLQDHLTKAEPDLGTPRDLLGGNSLGFDQPGQQFLNGYGPAAGDMHDAISKLLVGGLDAIADGLNECVHVYQLAEDASTL